MKKPIVLASILFFTLSSVCIASESTIKSILGVPFGQICTIKAKFIDKPNTYFAQNVSESKFYLKIIAINNKKLIKPITVEPVYKGNKIKKGKIYKFKAYETIASQFHPAGWTRDAQQINYRIRHKVMIKRP